ncbi:hypothetical protein GCM10010211_56240 [Streptomyces albospinus]|uniref:DUF6879 domain-containing protein n=1 Tax=Streptomyces albospinus TaxID=285515 RepID=A0ABQ2VGM6_9ACTN|nr:DUF6879 family protein [Streptomyces albospinus]GGU83030.1 hypothetical protein GCM10010211_56240 [Streptomyces albospinus]
MTKPPTFEDLLASTQRSAIHLEMRDGYMESDPSFIAWKAGKRNLPEDNEPERRRWLTWVRQATDRGAVIRRARVFSVPESDYLRFEHHVSDANVRAGEQIAWLPRRRATDIAFPGNDFWVFDNELVLVLHFTGDGESPEDWMELTTDPKIRDLCVSAFEAVWERAIPHSEYRPV